MKLKIAPDCSEGFKRLAIVVGIIAFVLTTASGFNQHSHRIDHGRSTCFDLHYEGNIKREEFNTEKEFIMAKARNKLEEQDCLSIYKMNSHDWIIMLLASLTAGYLVVLSIRTIGWVFAGFSKKEDKK